MTFRAIYGTIPLPECLERGKLPVPILTYHGVNILTNRYEENDHLGLAADLREINRLGYQIVSLSEIVDRHQGIVENMKSAKCLAITFDDGSWFDYHDLTHPTCGQQRSLFNILRDFQSEVGPEAQPGLHATSFVISSPGAREQLDRNGLIGRGWWGDDWWDAAQKSSLMSIQCHSWDRVHPDVETTAQADNIKGDFSLVASYADCDIQVRQAADYIASVVSGHRPDLFAYPYGQSSDYLAQCYFPEFSSRHGFRAAFSTDPRPLRRSDDIWRLPRFVFGRDWRSCSELDALLNRAFSAQ
ncbi:MAG: polysaccharide deacetylase family protein [Xanthomonadales bacterium]|nr:polysaccharide deacetylase family protein [Xanthomonadales bacterium]